MKRFKISFLAIIAIGAMSFTVASKSEILKRTVGPEDCFKPNAAWTAKQTCTSASVNFSTSSCPTAKGYLGYHLFSALSSITDSDIYEADIQEQSCPDNTGFFCCFNIEVDPIGSRLLNCLPTNPNQPQITVAGSTNYYRVLSVRCKVTPP